MFITKLIQVTVVACVYSLPMVSCQDVAKGLVGGVENILGDSTADTVKRYSMLYNACTQKHLNIIGKNVTALGKDHSPYSNVSLETVVLKKGTIGLKILGVKSGRYLCFNKRGKLIARFGGRHRRCMFKEIMTPDYYSQFQSLFNPDWLVGFNKKGKSLRGADHNRRGKRQNCFLFIKRGLSYFPTEQEQGPGPKMPPDLSRLHPLLQEDQERHRKRNGRRPKRIRHPSR